MRKFTLPISPEYVKHWGLWEAVRELYQNALDAQTIDPANRAEMVYDHSLRELVIGSTKGKLQPRTLILGDTDKTSDLNVRGQFGEGYKLALLVLSRMGFEAEIENGNEIWTSKIEFNEDFNGNILNIYIRTDDSVAPDLQGINFVVKGVDIDEWEKIQANIYQSSDEDESEVLLSPEYKGRIYVGGLYVTTDKKLHYGYSFGCGTIKLDRDRGMVNGYDLYSKTSELWAKREKDQIAVDLIEAEAPDVQYLEYRISQTSPVVSYSHSRFVERHGHDAVPVSTQEEIVRAQAAGVKWVLVPKLFKTVLGKIRSWFIPSVETPAERLRKLLKEHGWNLPDEAKLEIEDIIKVLEGTNSCNQSKEPAIQS